MRNWELVRGYAISKEQRERERIEDKKETKKGMRCVYI